MYAMSVCYTYCGAHWTVGNKDLHLWLQRKNMTIETCWVSKTQVHFLN